MSYGTDMLRVTEETMEDKLDYEFAAPVYVTSHRIDDWRYRSSKDGIMTAFFATQFISGLNPTANDDLEAVAFYSLTQCEQVIAKEHAPLLTSLRTYMHSLNK